MTGLGIFFQKSVTDAEKGLPSENDIEGYFIQKNLLISKI